ncbi:MAG TPA: thioredoxin family protein [Candidatus Dormibacteraeota bacterium]|nr:thioredoxin family protein [Candidatus Dormibacteraeota bacterium]
MHRRQVLNVTAAAALSAAVLVLAFHTVPAARAADELAIGAQGAAFNLKGTDGKMHSLDNVKGAKGTAVVFTCNECPFSKGYEDRLIALAKEFQPKGIGFVAINANDSKIVPGDGFEFMVKRAKDKNLPYPYVLDETQAIATAYGARVTPHVFLLDASGKLVYRGRVDDSLEQDKVTTHDFAAALDAVVGGQPVKVAETKAFGCGVKYAKR